MEAISYYPRWREEMRQGGLHGAKPGPIATIMSNVSELFGGQRYGMSTRPARMCLQEDAFHFSVTLLVLSTFASDLRRA